MNNQMSGDPAELTQLRQRVKDLENQLEKQRIKQHIQAMALDQIQDMVTITDLGGTITYVNQAQMQKVQRAREDLIEEKLLESEAALKAILDASTETISLIDQHGTVLVANEAMARSLRIPRENLIGCTLDELLPPEIALQRMTKIRQVMKTAQPVLFVDQRGHLVFESHIFPVFDHKGQVSRVAVFARDITRRAQVEKDLQQSQSLLNATQELVHAGGWEWDVASQSMTWTDETYRIHGISPTELSPGSPEHIEYSLNCYNLEDQPTVKEAFRLCVEQGQAYDLQFPFNAANGRRLWIRTMATAVWQQQRIVKVVGNIVDITHQKQMENILQARQRLLLEAATPLTLEEFLAKVLDEAEALTGSCVGFFHFFEKDQRTISRKTWSRTTLKSLGRTNGESLRRGIYTSGSWADCLKQKRPIVHNECAEMRHRNGSSAGHSEVLRELVVPILRGGQIVAVLGVGNKLQAYDQRDIEMVSILGDLAWDIVLRKQDENALRESEERFRFLLQNISSVAVQGYGPDGTTQFWNQASERLYGYSAREAIGRNLLELIIPPEMQADVARAIGQMAETGQPIPAAELSLMRQDGSRVSVFSSHAIVQIHGRTQELFCLDIDITALKQAEEKLKESVARFKALFNASSDSVLLIDPDGKILDLNTNAALRRNTDTTIMLGKSLFDFLPPDSAAMRRKAVEQILTEQKLVEYDEARDGKYYRVRLYPVFDDLGKVSKVASYSRDITESKLAEEELRQNEEKYRTLFENAGDAIFVHNDEEILGVNQLACDRLGYSRDELMAMSPCAMDTAKHFQHVPERRARLLAQGHLTFETEHQRKDGSILPVEVTSRLATWNGQSAIMSICRDITERKQADLERMKLEAQNRQLQKAESLGVMAGAIAHHFNNQLTVVMGNLEMALMDLPPDAPPVKSLIAAMIGARNAAGVSGQMLTYLGQTTGIRTALDLSETCRQSLPLLQATVLKGLIIKIDFPVAGPTISANKNQLQQLLTNLVTNACEAIGSTTGTVKLTIKTIAAADISKAHRFPLDWQAQAVPYAFLEVTDTGCGIPDKDIDKIFDPFFSTKFTGRGLGLPVILGIVKAHRGAVTVESAVGRGSTFRVFFPISAEDARRQPEQRTQIPSLKRSGTVLLVEDEEILREMAETMLRRLGYRVVTAKNGAEAVEVFRRHRDEISCVLSDLTMPGMNGWQTLAALRRISPDISVILSSGHDESTVLAGADLERPQAFLHKPYNMAELGATLAKMIGS